MTHETGDRQERSKPKQGLIRRAIEKLLGPIQLKNQQDRLHRAGVSIKERVAVDDQDAIPQNKAILKKLPNNEVQITAVSINECGVTGLRFVNDLFRKELLKYIQEKFFQQKKSISLWSIDLRNLKKLNDDLGHDGANIAIKSYVEGLRTRISAEITDTETEFVFYRPQSGGDEFYILFTGDTDTLNRLETVLPEYITEMECRGEDRDRVAVIVPVGGEYGKVFVEGEADLNQKILELELELAVPEELQLDLNEASDFAKIAHLQLLANEVANRILDKKKLELLIQEILKIDGVLKDALYGIDNDNMEVNEYVREQAIIAGFEKLENNIAVLFGSRRLTKMGAHYFLQIGQLLGIVKYKLINKVPLSTSDKVFLGIITPEQALDRQNLARAAIRGAHNWPELQRQIAEENF